MAKAQDLQHTKVRQLVREMLAQRSPPSMGLPEIGTALKKVGHFEGKLKKVLERWPADFDIENDTALLLNIASPASDALGLQSDKNRTNVGVKLERAAAGKGVVSSKPPITKWVALVPGKKALLSQAGSQPQSKKHAVAVNLGRTSVGSSEVLSKPLVSKLLASESASAGSSSLEPAQIETSKGEVAPLLTDSLSNSVSQYPLIRTKEGVQSSLLKIAPHSIIALDCEGCNLSRTGRVCLIQIAIPTEVFLFDLVAMDFQALEALKQGLGKILSDSRVTKVIHDCRQDSDALYHQLGIRLDGVFDTQASYVELLKVRKNHARSASGYSLLPGLNKLLREYAGKENVAKQDGKDLMEKDPLIWEKRPLSPVLLQYAAEDVTGLFAVRNGILLDYAKALEEQLARASAEYSSAFRNLHSSAGVALPQNTETRMVFDESGKLIPVSDSAQAAPSQEQAIEDNLEALLKALPEGIASDSALLSGSNPLMEVVLDFGRRPVARFLDRQRAFLGPETETVSQKDLDTAVQMLGAFGSDNRAGIPGTLHRISAMRDRDSGQVLGLTYRVGRAVTGAATPVRDLLRAELGGNILILGPPMTGKTTIVRDMARLLSRDNWVVIVDTSNEIAGVSAVPHRSVGHARRMQVKNLESQFATMIECVQNHAPEVIIIDEIGRKREAEAARTIAQRGVRLVSSAHGSLASLVSNPFLSELLGGVDLVLVGDKAANSMYEGRKNVRQRKQDSIFQTVIELSAESMNEWAIFTDVEAKVDKILKGEPFEAEMRCFNSETGERVRKEMRVPE